MMWMPRSPAKGGMDDQVVQCSVYGAELRSRGFLRRAAAALGLGGAGRRAEEPCAYEVLLALQLCCCGVPLVRTHVLSEQARFGAQLAGPVHAKGPAPYTYQRSCQAWQCRIAGRLLTFCA